MRRRTFLGGVFASLLALLGVGTRETAGAQSITRLFQAAKGPVDVTQNPLTGTPSFIRARIPMPPSSAANGGTTPPSPEATARAFVDRYADLFRITNSADELTSLQTQVDTLGMKHVTFAQTYRGLAVHGAYLGVHLDAPTDDIVAVSNGFVPGIALDDLQPHISANDALTIAHQTLPNGKVLAGPRLIVYPNRSCGCPPGPAAYLAWYLELADDSVPAHYVAIIDAITGTMELFDRLYTALSREIYTAGNTLNLPGTVEGTEGKPPTADVDGQNAYAFTGNTYDYYSAVFGRDSYDNNGASLVSTVHYGISYPNAYWSDASKQMIYGDGFPVQDVTGHELTHAVTANSVPGGLDYSWQSGALNESVSDIFGTMVEMRATPPGDWLIGEGLPKSFLGTASALRDMSNPQNPEVLAIQPADTADWVSTCSDNQGVHTNSGIMNKAFYNIATSIGTTKAAQIFYRVLTVYLQNQSGFEDARSAALQAAVDLFGSQTNPTPPESTAVGNGFDVVGIDGSWNPPTNNCGCAASTALADTSVFSTPLTALATAVTLYRVRDRLLNQTPTGQRYRRLYEANTGQMNNLLLKDSSLRSSAARILQATAPGLDALASGSGNHQTVTPELIQQVTTFLQQLAAADRAQGKGQLADTIEQNMRQVDFPHLIGMTYAEAWSYIDTRIGTTIYFPLVST